MFGLSRRILVALVAGAVAVSAAGVAYAGTITTPTGNPFVVPADGAGNPVPFNIVATGYTPGTQAYVEQCNGLGATSPGWSPTVDCDLGSSPAGAIVQPDGSATWLASDINHAFPVFKGESPQSLFNCLGPDDPPMTPINGLPDYRNCQVRVSSNNGVVTADQAFLNIQLPDAPGDMATTSTTTSTSSTSTTTTSSTTSTTTTTMPSTTTTTLPKPLPAKPTGVVARPAPTTLPATGGIYVGYVAGSGNGFPITKFTATCRSSNGGVTRSATHVGPTVVTIGVGALTLKRTYTCTVTETTSAGTSPASAPSAAVVVGAPARVATPGITRVAAGWMKVGFTLLTAAQMNGSPLTAPNYTATCTSSNGGVARAAAGTRSPIIVVGLTPRRTYTCTVRAHNARGYGQASPPSAPRVA